MMRLSLAALALLGLVSSLQARPDPAPAYHLTFYSAVIADKKPGGSDWDIFGGQPDPVVRFKVLDSATQKKTLEASTEVRPDTLQPVWNALVGNVKVGDLVQIEVWDKDFSSDDIIGKYEFKVTQQQVNAGKFKFDFQQVKELNIGLAPVEPRVVAAVPPVVEPVVRGTMPTPVVIVPPQPIPVPMPDPVALARQRERASQRDSTRQSIAFYENEMSDLNNKVVVAQLAMVAARKVYDDAAPGSFQEIAAQIGYIAAERGLADVRSQMGRTQSELEAARSRFNQLRD